MIEPLPYAHPLPPRRLWDSPAVPYILFAVACGVFFLADPVGRIEVLPGHDALSGVLAFASIPILCTGLIRGIQLARRPGLKRWERIMALSGAVLNVTPFVVTFVIIIRLAGTML